MIDIDFYIKVFEFKKRIMNGEKIDKMSVYQKLEEFRSKQPAVFNIETTNACNMSCEMCPRTIMTRPIENLDMETFVNVANQIKPISEKKWQEWESFVEEKYNIRKADMSENHFFLYIIPKVVVLHGYGDPLLDKHMVERIRILRERNIPSYFSCNPANMDIEKTLELFECGLDYMKYSMESTNDFLHKKIWGKASQFMESYRKILKILDSKKKNNFKTTAIITMLNLNRPHQEEEFEELKDMFKGYDVYIYLKSQDNRWYLDKKAPTKATHWIEFCQFPWSSLTIKSNGEVAMCVEDYNNEIILGDAKKESLYDIWNGEKYNNFRKNHIELNTDIKCINNCDMTLIGEMVSYL